MLRLTCRVLTLVAGLLPLALSVVAAQDAKPQAEVTLNRPQERTLDSPQHKGHQYRSQDAVFNLGQQTYAISNGSCVDKAHEGKVVPLEGYLGMPRPSSCNWYHSGFMFIALNGKDIGETPVSSMAVAERGDRAILDLVWHNEIANVRARFLGLPDHDNLYCELALEPKQEIKSIALQLRCYPSYFTSWNKRDGARRIQTPTTLVQQGQTVTLPAKDNWAAVYYDGIFDVAKGEGEGPCGLLFLPDEPSAITFAPGGYSVETRLTYPPQARRIHLAFWDFKGKTNAQALKRMQEGAETVRAELAGLDFTPAAVKGFDITAVRAEVERALKSEVAREALKDKIGQIKTWLEQYAPALEGGLANPGIEAEEKLLASVDKYYDFMWEIKLAELVSEM